MGSALRLHRLSPSVCLDYLLQFSSALLYSIFRFPVRMLHIYKTCWKEHHPNAFISLLGCIFQKPRLFHCLASNGLIMDCFLNLNIISLFQVYQKNWASLLTCLKKECYSYFINHFWFWIFYIIMMSYLHLCFILRLFYLIKLGRIEIGHHYNHLLLTFIFSLFINNFCYWN